MEGFRDPYEDLWKPVIQDYKQILEQLKSKDEMMIYEAVTNLSSSLSVAQENTLANFAIDQYIPALIAILKRPPESDISNEINLFAIQCLTNLMDIFPTICNSIVNHGAVQCFTEVLERSMGFIDLNDACIKAFEKISNENPYAILTSGSILLCLNMMDFFENTTQKRIINTLINVSRHAASEQDLNEHLFPIVPCLCNLLQTRGDHNSQSKIESISTIILRITESLLRFISPNTQIEKLSSQYESFGQTGVIDAILQALQDYCIFDSSVKQSSQSMVDTSPSKATSQASQNIMTNLTIQNFLKILSLGCKYSVGLTKMVLDFNIFKLIENFLPSHEDLKKLHFTQDQFPFVLETITLIDSVLPEREDAFTKDNENDKAKTRIENQKRALYQGSEQSGIAYVAEKMLPKIFYVYENNINISIRSKALQIIDKLILLFNEELLNNFIEPYSFAKFIFSNLQANQISSVLICLQMVDKLMKSNPKTYYLPLLREGVAPFIKKLSSIEQLEQSLGFKINDFDNLEKQEDFLAHAKSILLSRYNSQSSDPEQRALFEQQLQKYLEFAKVAGAGQNPYKQQIQQAKSIVALAETLNQQFFENQEFINSINALCGEEFQILNKLKALANEILQEAKQDEFNLEKNKALIESLTDNLTSARHIMSFELKESGLLESLQLYLTSSPKQVQLYLEKSKNQGEEIKHSEEIQINTMTKNAKNVTKKQARCFVQRLKLFLHVILNTKNNKQPLAELVNLCHELLSQNEHLIFENQQPGDQANLFSTQSQIYGGIFSSQLSDPNQSMNALKQLTRRVRVNLIYDPTKSCLKKNEKSSTDQLMMESNDLLPADLSITKSQSHHPAFLHLAGRAITSESRQSKVFIKRNFLYQELKSVLISVEQCASLWLLEDFLRTKIKTGEDVKNLRAPPSFYQQMKSSSTSKHGRQIMDKAMDKMRELMESGSHGERMRTESEEFSQLLADEIVNSKELTEKEQLDIIKQLEIQTLQILDEYYAAGGGSDDNDEMRDDFEERLLEGTEQAEDMDTESRILEFQRTIDRVRDAYRVKLEQKRAEEKQKEIEKKRQAESASVNTESRKQSAAEDDTEMKDEVIDTSSKYNQEQSKAIEEVKQEESKQESSEVQNLESSKAIADVDMTDEEEEEARRQMEELQKRMQKRAAQAAAQSSQKEVQLSVQEDLSSSSSQQQKDIIEMDLEELIKANGDDIEYEFYYCGKVVGQNQTLFEIIKSGEALAKKAKDSGSGLHSYYNTLSNSDQSTIYFSIKDKNDDLKQSRKDSILEFSQKRERTKSEAVNDISVSSINQIVQQWIDKEFQVFSEDLIEKSSQEKKQLEYALKILKTLNFMCKNSNLFSSQGIKFLINSSINEEEEFKEDTATNSSGFSDLDLQSGLAQLHANLFHHPKLDAYILKNIQDPYNLIGGAISEVLQQIFRNCSFLFPFQTRMLFFKLVSFIGSIDMNRSIYFLRQFLKNKVGKVPDDKSSAKFQKQKVKIDRTKIIESSFSLIKQINKRAFLEVQYKEEQGTGLGPTLEFYYLVATDLKQQPLLWRKNMSDNSLFPAPLNLVKTTNEQVQTVYELFRLTGVMIAKSVSDDRLIDLPLSSVFWDLALGKKMSIFDMERIDKDLFKIFAEFQLLANKKRDIDKQTMLDSEAKLRQLNSLKTSQGARIEDLALAFVLPGYEDIELKLNGKNTDVTIHNLQEFIDLTLHYLFQETVKVQIQAFRKGFNQIFPIDTLKPFSTANELEDMICGTQRNSEEWTNTQKLMENIVPAHGYHSKSTQYQNLLRFMSELDPEERRKFLKFVTGSPRLPNGGFSSLEPRLTVVLKKPTNPNENPDDILPSVMTCQNYVKLPNYSSYDILKKKFEQAYNEGCNNFTLS